MSAVRNRRELQVVRGPELTKEQVRLKAPTALRRHIRKVQLKLVLPPRSLGPVGFRFIVLLVALILLAIPAWASEILAIELVPVASVKGKIYRVGHIANYLGGDTELWDAIAAEPVGYAPLPGATASLTAANLLGLLKERGYQWQSIAVSGKSVTVQTATKQDIDNVAIYELLRNSLIEELGVDASINEQRPLPALSVPSGAVTTSVRYPDKPGQWLPQAIEFYVDGRLHTTLPLAQYVRFSLPVVVASTQIPGRTSLTATDLALAVQELRPGNEVATNPAALVGLETRARINADSLVRLSQLKRPFDVRRGDTVTLLIDGSGAELRAVATAQNSAYTGQNVLVVREGDGLRFTGQLQENKVVVVE